MRTGITTLVIATALLAWSGIAQADATQIWRCEMGDDATEEEVTALAQKWLAAVKKIEGGEQFKAYVYFPVAVNATGEIDMLFVVVAPSFEEWGKFWDRYPDSSAAEMDQVNQGKVICPDSVVWESMEVKAE